MLDMRGLHGAVLIKSDLIEVVQLYGVEHVSHAEWKLYELVHILEVGMLLEMLIF